MSNRHRLLQLFKAICLVWTLGVSMNAYATSTFTWKEEVLLHDGKKIIVERLDTYDSRMPHEIRQGAPLAEHKTTFMIPGTNQTVTWKSDNRPSPDSDNLHLLALDFLDGVPHVVTRASAMPTTNGSALIHRTSSSNLTVRHGNKSRSMSFQWNSSM